MEEKCRAEMLDVCVRAELRLMIGRHAALRIGTRTHTQTHIWLLAGQAPVYSDWYNMEHRVSSRQ